MSGEQALGRAMGGAMGGGEGDRAACLPGKRLRAGVPVTCRAQDGGTPPVPWPGVCFW